MTASPNTPLNEGQWRQQALKRVSGITSDLKPGIGFSIGIYGLPIPSDSEVTDYLDEAFGSEGQASRVDMELRPDTRGIILASYLAPSEPSTANMRAKSGSLGRNTFLADRLTRAFGISPLDIEKGQLAYKQWLTDLLGKFASWSLIESLEMPILTEGHTLQTIIVSNVYDLDETSHENEKGEKDPDVFSVISGVAIRWVDVSSEGRIVETREMGIESLTRHNTDDLEAYIRKEGLDTSSHTELSLADITVRQELDRLLEAAYELVEPLKF